MGVYLAGVGGGSRSWKCPRWITTLQQAELLCLLKACQLASYMQLPILYLGTGSWVSHCQSVRMRGSATPGMECCDNGFGLGLGLLLLLVFFACLQHST